MPPEKRQKLRRSEPSPTVGMTETATAQLLKRSSFQSFTASKPTRRFAYFSNITLKPTNTVCKNMLL